MAAAVSTEDVLLLAASREPEDRERLMLALVDLCAQSDEALGSNPVVQELMNTVFLRLVQEAEHDIRQALAEKLATATWAPSALVNILAMDEIEIARPIIAQSPVLQDEDLMRLLALAAIEHQIEVASRPAISAQIVQAILGNGDPAVLTALAANDTADISPAGMDALVEASRLSASIRSPLVRHPRMTPEMAERLYVWVGQSLRSAIVSRFRVDAEALDRAIEQAVATAHSPPKGRLEPIIRTSETEQRDMERKLAAKLNASGQLRPGYLIRALREKRLGLFVASLAEMLNVETTAIELSINRERPDLLALACNAAGLDRSAFTTLLGLVRDLNSSRPGGSGEELKRAMNAFAHPPQLAHAAFRRALAA